MDVLNQPVHEHDEHEKQTDFSRKPKMKEDKNNTREVAQRNAGTASTKRELVAFYKEAAGGHLVTAKKRAELHKLTIQHKSIQAVCFGFLESLLFGKVLLFGRFVMTQKYD